MKKYNHFFLSILICFATIELHGSYTNEYKDDTQEISAICSSFKKCVASLLANKKVSSIFFLGLILYVLCLNKKNNEGSESAQIIKADDESSKEPEEIEVDKKNEVIDEGSENTQIIESIVENEFFGQNTTTLETEKNNAQLPVNNNVHRYSSESAQTIKANDKSSEEPEVIGVDKKNNEVSKSAQIIKADDESFNIDLILNHNDNVPDNFIIYLFNAIFFDDQKSIQSLKSLELEVLLKIKPFQEKKIDKKKSEWVNNFYIGSLKKLLFLYPKDLQYWFCDGNEIREHMDTYFKKIGKEDGDAIMREYIQEFNQFDEENEDLRRKLFSNGLQMYYSIFFLLHKAREKNIFSLKLLFYCSIPFLDVPSQVQYSGAILRTDHNRCKKTLEYLFDYLFFESVDTNFNDSLQEIFESLLYCPINDRFWEAGYLHKLLYSILQDLYSKKRDECIDFINKYKKVLFFHGLYEVYENKKDWLSEKNIPNEIYDFITSINNVTHIEYKKYKVFFFLRQYILFLFMVNEVVKDDNIVFAVYENGYEEIFFSHYLQRYSFKKEKNFNFDLLTNRFSDPELLQYLKEDKKLNDFHTFFRKLLNGVYWSFWDVSNCSSSKCEYWDKLYKKIIPIQLNEVIREPDFYDLTEVEHFYKAIFIDGKTREINIYQKNEYVPVNNLLFQLHAYQEQYHSSVLKNMYHEIKNGTSFQDVFCEYDDCVVCSALSNVINAYIGLQSNSTISIDRLDFNACYSMKEKLDTIKKFLSENVIDSVFCKIENNDITLHQYFIQMLQGAVEETNAHNRLLPQLVSQHNEKECEKKLTSIYNDTFYIQSILNQVILIDEDKIDEKARMPDYFNYNCSYCKDHYPSNVNKCLQKSFARQMILSKEIKKHVFEIDSKYKDIFDDYFSFLELYNADYHEEHLLKIKNEFFISKEEKQKMSLEQRKGQLQKEYDFRQCLQYLICKDKNKFSSFYAKNLHALNGVINEFDNMH